ncbi:MAG: hypothetical protein AABX48_01145 [Nanoarchaeota archaeon]
MEKETITIPKKEYERLKMIEMKVAEVDLDFVKQISRSLEDVKAGRIRRVA